MFDHITIYVSNLDKSRLFYEQAFKPLNYKMSFGKKEIFWAFDLGNGSLFEIAQHKGEVPLTSVHVAFRTQCIEEVNNFYNAALAAGAKGNGEPGPRPQYTKNYYACFVHDLDGHNIEAMFDTPQIKLVPYKEVWKDDFEGIKKDIFTFCKNEIVSVHHIGSTSIPSMTAKDIIDVQVGIENFNRIQVLIELMSRAGFEILPHILQDHAPGHEFDEFVPGWEKRFFKANSSRRPANVHVRRVDGENFKFALLFRDFLRSAKEASRAYEQTKLRLVLALGNCQKDYTLIKDPICDLIMLQAKKWAVETRWELDL